ncbi:ATP-binding cassette domain-containing protein [Kitasatospora sp. NPDC008050]|uniref:ABC transporter ATP-binding protein n=1 Tax=Kitasatospora sp. NPDC008050 TaxID=3364021 RepID=UPI0036EDBF7D
MTGTNTVALDVRDLRREYESRGWRGPRTTRVALNEVNLRIDQGEVHGLLGPNGAGKTTLVKILATTLLPTSGQVRVYGHDVLTEAAEVRREISLVLGGDRGLYQGLSARQNLCYWAALQELGRAEAKRQIEEVLERFGLAERADVKVETFSRGMKQRLHLARGLVGRARLIVLDEPTMGMDPVAARAFRDLVRALRDEGRSLLLATHDMAEAEELCDRVTLINEGRILTTETPEALSRLMSRHEHIDVEEAPQPLLKEIADLAGVASVEERGAGSVRIRMREESAARTVLSLLVAAGVTRIRTGRPSLDDVYVEMLGERGLKVSA